MPLPEPSSGESHDDFIERCMGDETVHEDFEDTDQMLAVCERQWDEGKTMSHDPEHKSVASVEVKDEDQGEVRAVVATLGVKDKDGDVIAPGAFGEQDVLVSAYNHESWQGAPPVGRGTVREVDDKAVADLKFFMDTTSGRDHFKIVKNMAELGRWSFGFNITEEATPDEEQQQQGVHRVLKGLEVHEVSPVLRAAGIGTETVSAKCDECAAKEDEPEEETKDDDTDDAGSVEIGRMLLREAKDNL